MVRGRDACWEYCNLVDATRQKVRCNYCQREFSGGVYRIKFHLAQIRNKDIVPCAKVPDDVRDQIQAMLNVPKKLKASKKQKLDPAVNGVQETSSASDDVHPNHGSSTSPSVLIPHTSPTPHPATDDPQKKKQDNADRKIAMFFFHNSIPFSAAKSMYYQDMVDAVTECGVGYEAPGSETLRSTLLEKVKGDITDRYQKLRDEWRDTGCTILCDSWSDDRRTKSIIVFSATCPKGTFFLKSVDVSGHEDDAHYLFELLESVVVEVGAENVVQIITDSTVSYLYVGRLLMAKYPSLFWSPCASRCVNQMLEDFSNLDWVREVLKEANTITGYLYSHPEIINMTRKFTGGKDLVRPKITKFVSDFLSLRAIVIQEDNLKHMFSHVDWLTLSYTQCSEERAITSLLHSEKFWKSARDAVSVSESLVKILRMVDGDMPAMGYIFDAMERAKITIKSFYKGVDEKFIPIWDIIDRRWNITHSPLHAAAAFLNPSIFYSMHYKADSRMRNGFQEAMMKMAIEDKDKIEITKEHPMYINGQGALGTDFAIMGRTLNSPSDWWAGYGYEIPTLQRAAIRILSQPCSSHWGRWNWRSFEAVYTEKSNTSQLDKCGDLLFVHCNLWLQEIVKSMDGKHKPILYDDIDVSTTWPTESESSPALMINSWLDDFPLE